MNDAPVLLILGILFLLGLAADLLGRSTPVPRVTLLIVSGLAVGPAGFNIISPELISDWFPLLTTLALSMVGFLLGQKLSLIELQAHGRIVLRITLGETTGALILVAVALLLMGMNPVPALLLAGIATATAPAATFDIVKESGVRGEFADTLLAVVALDDAWALFLFSLMLAAAASVNGDSSITDSLVGGFYEIGGSMLLGALLGAPMAFLTGQIRPGEPMLAEAMGFVLLCGGIATWLDLSPILSAMIMGSVVASLASHCHGTAE